MGRGSGFSAPAAAPSWGLFRWKAAGRRVPKEERSPSAPGHLARAQPAPDRNQNLLQRLLLPHPVLSTRAWNHGVLLTTPFPPTLGLSSCQVRRQVAPLGRSTGENPGWSPEHLALRPEAEGSPCAEGRVAGWDRDPGGGQLDSRAFSVS